MCRSMLISSVLRFVSNFDRYARSRSGLFTRPSTGYVNLCFPSCHVNTRRYKLLYYDNCLEKAEIYIYISYVSFYNQNYHPLVSDSSISKFFSTGFRVIAYEILHSRKHLLFNQKIVLINSDASRDPIILLVHNNDLDPYCQKYLSNGSKFHGKEGIETKNLFDIYLFTAVERSLERNKFYYCYRES